MATTTTRVKIRETRMDLGFRIVIGALVVIGMDDLIITTWARFDLDRQVTEL